MPRSPTYFERNLEVWRQLWRVTEISQIILVLLDSRCPLLHYPQSLSSYLSNRKHLLVLTKIDIAGAALVEAWTKYLNKRHPGLRVVPVESYIEKDPSLAHQGRKQFEPYVPECFRERLVKALRELHTEMLEPPEKVKSNPVWLENWKPPVKHNVDWEALMKARGSNAGAVGGPPCPRSRESDESAEECGNQEPEFLTIGLIGQPNVGKSSLLNALFGAHKVKASKTPGKTKHFQTLFWTPDVRLVDCPGLVMPNLVPMEMQVLSGILPISRISAIPACIYHVAHLLPLELVYKLMHPNSMAPSVKDKRTWREAMKSDSSSSEKPLIWTTMDVLTAYANSKGWVTAKAGRPDVHRAGNAILRSLAEARIGWAFWPPESDTNEIVAETQAGAGVWIPGGNLDEESQDESEEEDSEQNTQDSEEELNQEDSTEDEDGTVVKIGRFGALVLDDNNEEDEVDNE